LPATRRNEVLGFLKNNTLGDLCISRPKSRLSWGIPIPFDRDFVTYVWFDALLNYFSATRYLVSHPETAKLGDFWWPASCHIVGKDILTTHAVYWSTMLMALNFPLPENIYAHGWWTVEGKKMSKSLENVVDPYKMVEEYGTDAFRYFLFREVPFGLDGDFSESALVNRLNTDLANDLGNLLNRFLTMAEKYFGGSIEQHPIEDLVKVLINEHERERIHAYEYWTAKYWSNLSFNLILEGIWWLVSATNNFIAKTEPWKLAKDNQLALKSVMYQIWQSLRMTAIFLYPFMPAAAEKMWFRLGLGSEDKSLEETVRDNPDIIGYDWHPDFSIKVSKGEHLFPRIEKVEKT
jgi:methionyl-tRNA synthetase